MSSCLMQAKGQVHYRCSPEYLAKIFAPYLPVAEQEFIEHLAIQNQYPAVIGGQVKIDAKEIADRALYWESYLQQYPKVATTKMHVIY